MTSKLNFLFAVEIRLNVLLQMTELKAIEQCFPMSDASRSLILASVQINWFLFPLVRKEMVARQVGVFHCFCTINSTVPFCWSAFYLDVNYSDVSY